MRSALGGVGITLKDLVQLYTGLANRGRPAGSATAPRPVRRQARRPHRCSNRSRPGRSPTFCAGVRPPAGAAQRGIAYKTGTSYGYRDAWSVGFDGRHVLGVWVGRPDNGAVPGLAGYVTAAPILFEAFAKSGIAAMPLPRPPAGALRNARRPADQLARFAPGARRARRDPRARRGPTADRLSARGRACRSRRGKATRPLMLKLQGGRAPFRWLANGRPVATPGRKRVAAWGPDGPGTSTLTVIDAAGRAASVTVAVE